jgi:predicted metal-dependent enzyme (double-stranded beta helix superfamily)
MYVEMPSFVSALEEMAAHGVDRAGVQSYLEQTPVAPASLDPYVWYRPDRYTRNGIHKSEPFEILVLCWGPGHKAPIHGHEGELCWARVERGRLRFVNYRLVSEQPLLLEPSGPPVDGAVGHVDGPADLHSVENCEQFGEPAVTLHVYSRPYPECDIYDLERGERRRVRMAYDTVAEKSES